MEEIQGENKKAIFYCDESGNTGPNYIDQEQPFYTLAAWSVPYNKIVDASVVVEEHRKKYSPQSDELKASNLIRTSNGKRGIMSLIRTLGSLGCVPIYEVLEKRYCVAGKIVETFMDPLYNPLVNNDFIPDSTTKQEIANTLYDGLSDSTLNRFAAVYRNPILTEFEGSLNEIITCVNDDINIELAEILKGSLARIKEISEVEMSASFMGNMQDSLNYPVFVGILMMIEVFGRLGIVAPTKIVHDEIHSFQEHLYKVFIMLRNAREGVFTFPNGSFLVFPLKHVEFIEFATSKDSVLIQAADILAGSVNYLSKCAIQQKRIEDLDIELAEHLFPALLIELPQIAWSVGSSHWHSQLGSYYFKRFRGPKEMVLEQKSESRYHFLMPAPLLPNITKIGKEDQQKRKYIVPIPIYALLEKDDRIVSVEVVNSASGHKDISVLLFSEEKYAKEVKEQFIKERKEDENLKIILFGPGDIHKLVFRLERIKEYANIIVFDINKKMAMMSLNDFILNLKRMLDRIERAISSGIYKQMFKLHYIDGIKIMSYLCVDGSYMAGIYPDGKLYRAKSREEAVNAVARGEFKKR